MTVIGLLAAIAVSAYNKVVNDAKLTKPVWVSSIQRLVVEFDDVAVGVEDVDLRVTR
jgi:hypothetical protein